MWFELSPLGLSWVGWLKSREQVGFDANGKCSELQNYYHIF